jgi:ubiquinone/menaquinone biosynthesis C-methylase UbiE
MYEPSLLPYGMCHVATDRYTVCLACAASGGAHTCLRSTIHRNGFLKIRNGSSPLRTTSVRDHADICACFDACAEQYAETHGDPASLLGYRLALIRDRAPFQSSDVVLEIGCGNGLHILALADSFDRGIGIDLSPGMLRVGRRHVARSPWRQKLQFTVELAEQLDSVADASIDVAFSVGALEHMLDKGRIVANVFRVLRPGGRFICLTPNGHYLWYPWLAPLCSLETRRLSTDWSLSRHQLAHFLYTAGFRDPAFSYWTFIPRGDMHPLHAALLDVLDRCGRITAPDLLRGGLAVGAQRYDICG